MDKPNRELELEPSTESSSPPTMAEEAPFKEPEPAIAEAAQPQNFPLEDGPKIDYKPPPWAQEPSRDDGWGIEIIKNGLIIGTINFADFYPNTFVVVGRLPTCDVQFEHPTISRYHCILQYGEDRLELGGKGWFMYDLGSTHGSRLNKQRIPSKRYVRIRVGHVMQFGGSSRIVTLKGPPTDVEMEWECSPTEMRLRKEREKLAKKLPKDGGEQPAATATGNEEGISWGIDYDEEQAYVHARQLELDEQREASYVSDPLKILGHFFDREGFEMEFTYSETGTAHTHKWTCQIELPVDLAAGQSLSATATCAGSKKEALLMCALNACRTLDMHGVLYESRNVARKKAKNLAENDFYDSDEDIYLDRTGQIEKNRESRRRRAMEAKGEEVQEKDTYESLLKKIAIASEEMQQIEKRLEQLSSNQLLVIGSNSNSNSSGTDDDELDLFCKNLEKTRNPTDSIEVKTEKSHLRQKLVELKHQIERMNRLAKIAKPVELPSLKIPIGKSSSSSDAKPLEATISTSTMNKLLMLRRSKAAELRRQTKPQGPHFPMASSSDEDGGFVVEVEEEEEDDDDEALPVRQPAAPPSAKSPSVPSAADGTSTVKQPAQASAQSPSAPSTAQGTLAVKQPAPLSAQSPSVATKPQTTASSSSSAPTHRSALSSQRLPATKEVEVEAAEVDEEDGYEAADQQPPSPPSSASAEHSGALRQRKRMRTRAERDASTKGSSSTKSGEYGEGCVNRDEEYATWLPPDNQRGDGTTALNAKFAGRY